MKLSLRNSLILRSGDSSVSIVMGFGLDRWGSIPCRSKIFLFSTASRPAMGPTQPSIQWVLGVSSLRVKQLGHEADHSPPSSADIKNGGAIAPLHLMSSWLHT
jgi:hypothetical protein